METDSVLEAVLSCLGKQYRLVKHLGGGEFSNVYLIKDTARGHQRALKIMDHNFLLQRFRKQNLTDTKQKFLEIKRRFEVEANLYKKIQHPNIAKIYDTGVFTIPEEGIEIPYFVMSYIEGADLAEKIRKSAPFDLSFVTKIARDVLSALDSIHKNNIVHRDLKPANIMIEESSGKAVIIDLGIAKDVVSGTKLTATGSLLGSPSYMAPEQFIDSSSVGPSLDIYAFGVVLFEMLTGETPFKGSNFIEVMNAHHRRPIPEVVEMNPSLPPGATYILEKALAKDPANRYQNATDFMADLEKIYSVEPLKKSEQVSIFRRMTWAALVIVVLTGIIIVGMILFRDEPSAEWKPETAKIESVIVPPPSPPTHLVKSVRKKQENRQKEDEKKPQEDPKEKVSYEEIKNSVTPSDYLEFRRHYPQSRYLGELKERLYTLEPNLPPEKYWTLPLIKNNRDYYQYTFSTANSTHVMIYIPSKKLWIDKYEVAHHQIGEHGELPALVSYDEADEYCKRNGFRLPTEDEWEYIAGVGQGLFPWGNELPGQDGEWRANFDTLVKGVEQDGYDTVAPVKSFEAYSSPLGAVNMAGNVWEWVKGGILKGGSFLSTREELLIKKKKKGEKNEKQGFRCIKEEHF